MRQATHLGTPIAWFWALFLVLAALGSGVEALRDLRETRQGKRKHNPPSPAPGRLPWWNAGLILLFVGSITVTGIFAIRVEILPLVLVSPFASHFEGGLYLLVLLLYCLCALWFSTLQDIYKRTVHPALS